MGLIVALLADAHIPYPGGGGVLSPKSYVDVPARPRKSDYLYTNFLPNFPPISIPFSKEKHPIWIKLGAFYNNLPKIHPIYVIWAPSSLMKTPRSLYQILWKSAPKGRHIYVYHVSVRTPPPGFHTYFSCIQITLLGALLEGSTRIFNTLQLILKFSLWFGLSCWIYLKPNLHHIDFTVQQLKWRINCTYPICLLVSSANFSDAQILLMLIEAVSLFPVGIILYFQSFHMWMHQILHIQLRASHRAARNSSVKCQCSYLSNNTLSRYLVLWCHTNSLYYCTIQKLKHCCPLPHHIHILGIILLKKMYIMYCFISNRKQTFLTSYEMQSSKMSVKSYIYFQFPNYLYQLFPVTFSWKSHENWLDPEIQAVEGFVKQTKTKEIFPFACMVISQNHCLWVTTHFAWLCNICCLFGGLLQTYIFIWIQKASIFLNI